MHTDLIIRDQPSLPMRRLIGLCASGIQHRLLRSLITLSVVVLGIAFLANSLTEAVVAASMKQAVADAAQDSRFYNRFVAVTEPTGSARGLVERVVGMDDESWEEAIVRPWLGVTETAFASLRDEIRSAAVHLRWLADLNAGHRRVLFGKRRDDEALRWTGTPEGLSHVRDALAATPSLVAPPGLIEFAAGYAALQGRLEALSQQFDERARRLRTAGWPLDTQPVLATGGADAASDLDRRLRDTGVVLPEETLTRLAAACAQTGLQRRVTAQLDRPENVDAWQRRFGEVLTPSEMLEHLAADPARGQWLHEQWQPSADAPDIEVIVAAATRLVQARRLNTLGTQLAAAYGDGGVLSSDMVWLIAVSFLVCLVGIANAMLISVLERFAEIATMKCLGALDSSVALLFLMESAALGLMGGALGLLLGLATGFLRLGVGYGEWVFHRFDLEGILLVVLGSLVTAVVLTTLAASYPAWMASRLLPVEAMRVE